MASKPITAHMFYERVIKESDDDVFFSRLLSNFSSQFFTNLHTIAVRVLAKADLCMHFHSFFSHLTRSYGGQDLAFCYAEHYVR